MAQSSSLQTITDDISASNILSGFKGSPEGHSGGKYVQLLEEKFCRYFSVKHAIALNSATAALHASLIACGIGSGDEVIVTPYSFSSSASCVLMVGAKPVFVDIQDDIFSIDPDKIEPAITSKTKAIIPVHLCGHPADMDRIMAKAGKHGLFVIEDAAQSIGAIYKGRYVGTIGDCGIFSFNQNKHINTGEGGMLITDNDEIARKVRAIRNHGEISDPDLKLVGYNYRLCEIEAALALEQFKVLDEMTDIRIKLTSYMTERLLDIPGFTPPVTYPGCKHVFYTYGLRIDSDIIGLSKTEFCEQLGGRDDVYFGTYVEPLYYLPIYQQFGYKKGLCPVTERLYEKELIVTDIFKYPLTLKDVDRIVDTIKGIIRG